MVSDHGSRAADDGDEGLSLVPLTARIEERISEEVGTVEVARLGKKLTISMINADLLAVEKWLASLVRSSSGEALFDWERLSGPSLHADGAGGPNGSGIAMTSGSIGLTLRDLDLGLDEMVNGDPILKYVKLGKSHLGVHDAEGMLLAFGQDIPNGVQLEPTRLIDVAPTLLGLLRLPLSADMEGRAVFGETLPRVLSYKHLAPWREGHETKAEVNQDALRAIGYIE